MVGSVAATLGFTRNAQRFTSRPPGLLGWLHVPACRVKPRREQDAAPPALAHGTRRGSSSRSVCFAGRSSRSPCRVVGRGCPRPASSFPPSRALFR